MVWIGLIYWCGLSM